MLRTAIIAMLEPFSLTLDKSLAWQVAQTLRQGDQFTLSDNRGVLGSLRGVTPLLQPILADVDGTLAALVYLRVVLAIAPPRDHSFLKDYSSEHVMFMEDPTKSLTATLLPCTSTFTDPITLLLVAQELSPLLSATAVSALKQQTQQSVDTFWGTEPINFTTTPLHLTTTGQAVSEAEIRVGSAEKAQLVIANGSIAVIPHVLPFVTAGMKKWLTAGKINTFVNDAGSTSCTSPTTCGAGFSCGANSCSCGSDCGTCSDCGDCGSCGSCSS